MLFLLLSGLACAPKEPEPELTLSQEAHSLSSGQSTVSMFVTSNYDWTATTSAGWIVLSTASGIAGKTTFSFQVKANGDPDARTGSIIVRCRELSKTITVTQAQKDAVVVSGEKAYEFQADGGLLTVDLQSNVDYETSFPDWISSLTTKALTKYTHTFSVSDNGTGRMRTGEIIFRGKTNAVSDTVVVRQFSRYSMLGIRHTAHTICLPLISGESLQGTVDWGDGKTENYAPSLSHNYSSIRQYLVKVELEKAHRVSFSDLTDIDAIDFSRF